MFKRDFSRVRIVSLFALTTVIFLGGFADAGVQPAAIDAARKLDLRASTLRNSVVEFMYIAGSAKHDSVDLLENKFRSLPKKFANTATEQTLIGEIVRLRGGPVRVFRGVVAQNGLESVSKWRVDAKAIQTFKDAGQEVVPEQFAIDAASRQYLNGTAGLVLDDKSVHLYRDADPLDLPALSNIDNSINPWSGMWRDKPLEHQEVSSESNGDLVKISYLNSGLQSDSRMVYSYDVRRGWSPVSVVGERYPKGNPVDAVPTITEHYLVDSLSPNGAVAGIIHRAAKTDGIDEYFIALVSSWKINRADEKLPIVELPKSFVLFDHRYGGAPLVKKVTRGDGDRSLDGLSGDGVEK